MTFFIAYNVNLNPDRKSLFHSGEVRDNKAYISTCGFQKDWSNIPIRMRKGFNFRYEENCDCNVSIHKLSLKIISTLLSPHF